MAQSLPPKKRLYTDEFRVLPIPEGVDPMAMEECSTNSEPRKAESQSSALSRRGGTRKSRQSDTPTKMPENPKLSPIVPNAPVKSCNNAARRPDVRRKKLEYTESVVQRRNTTDSGINSLDIESAPLSRIDENPGGTKKPETKQFHTSQHSERKKLPNCNKENDSSLAKDRQTEQRESSSTRETRSMQNRSNSISSKNPKKRKESSSAKTAVLASNRGDDHPDRLKWLKTHADDGTWIECCRKDCGKWRFVIEYEDPADVPEEWYCDMNADRHFASCDVPEEEIPEKVSKQLIENKYRVGSIVWARLDGYPWWPSMIHDCPTSLQYYELDDSSNVPTKYHVIFFDSEKIQYAWVRDKDLKPYAKNTRETVVKKTKFGKKNYNKQMDVLCALANQALELSISERIERFGLVTRGTKIVSTIMTKPSANKRRCLPIRGQYGCGQSVNLASSSITDERELEPKRYNLGDIVWAHADKNPWWPAMIDRCPNTLKYYQFPESPRLPIEYHVVYFQNKILEWDWRAERDLILFPSRPNRQSVAKKTKYGKIDYRRQLDKACELAREAEKLSVEQRLARFSEIARLRPTLCNQRELEGFSQISSQTSDIGSSSEATYSSSLSHVSEWNAIDVDQEIVSICGQNVNEAGTSSLPDFSMSRQTSFERMLNSIDLLPELSDGFSSDRESRTGSPPYDDGHGTSSNYPMTKSESDVLEFFSARPTAVNRNRVSESMEGRQPGSSPIGNSARAPARDSPLFSSDPWELDEALISQIISSSSDEEQQEECPREESYSSRDEDMAYTPEQREYILATLFG